MRDDSELFFYVADRPKPTPGADAVGDVLPVSPGYKDAMGLQLIKGRFHYGTGQ